MSDSLINNNNNNNINNNNNNNNNINNNNNTNTNGKNFEVNEIVWAKLARYPYWPGWIIRRIETSSKTPQWEVMFGYDDGNGLKGRVPDSRVFKFISTDQFDELQKQEAEKKQTSKKRSRKKDLKADMNKLKIAMQRAAQDLKVWESGVDRRRHCVCRMFDDGRQMIGCDRCDFCWLHPECIGIEMTDEMKKNPKLVPKFDCPLIEWCSTCRTHHDEEKRKKSIKKKRILARRSGGHANAKKLKVDPDETETDTSDSDENFTFDGYYNF